MNRITIQNALRHSADGAMFITRTQIKECLACGNGTVDTLLKGLDFVRFGGDKATKRYDISEVADRMMVYKIGG